MIDLWRWGWFSEGAQGEKSPAPPRPVGGSRGESQFLVSSLPNRVRQALKAAVHLSGAEGRLSRSPSIYYCAAV